MLCTAVPERRSLTLPVEYAEDLDSIDNDKLKTLAQEIRNEVHSKMLLSRFDP